jgi:S1-C subfamily serine protease
VSKYSLVTNNHVVEGKRTIELLFPDGERLTAKIRKSDPVNDVAILEVEEAALPPAIPLSSQAVASGASVFTIGYPFPTVMGAEPKITDGIVNSESGMLNDPRVLQISVPIQQGNSGGPLLNARGEVVGIVTFKLDAAQVFEWTGDLPENVNYAVKSGYISPLLQNTEDEQTAETLPRTEGTLEELMKRVSGSVAIVIAK